MASKQLKSFIVVALLAIFVSSFKPVAAGPLAYGICQTGCNAMVVACYSAAGFTFGTVTAGTGIPAAIAACNAALGTCMAACVAAGCTPTP
ncbi:hypothetical protein GPECTOR_9g533 [Gonium pectorale]|uniref:Zygote-specific protein n=1 Tax=Gonium pectorale TaxID=33097 RepID=A0A150GRM7_GONPE|nr:hypothetical protein GPECTOR_9g533 [Gonium pectorale]|eukprot:KXZ52489.1 hypothetical protein GPECTOR_9g533 [Gonium pectorale]